MSRSRAAVLGSPIAHSLSPVLHRAAYAELGLDWAYDVIECDAAGLAGLLPRLVGSAYRGLSLTMPLKEAVLPLLDRVDERAALLQAVNTVVVSSDATCGYNTDVDGVLDCLDELPPTAVAGPVLLLGAGGAARAALAALAQRGVRELAVLVRDPGRAEALRRLAASLGVGVTLGGWPDAAAAGRAAALVVAATPAGAAASILPSLSWPPGTALLDVSYHPWPTPLAAAATAAGAPVVGGLVMLVGQAVSAVRLMTGRAPSAAVLRAAGERALAARELAAS